MITARFTDLEDECREVVFSDGSEPEWKILKDQYISADAIDFLLKNNWQHYANAVRYKNRVYMLITERMIKDLRDRNMLVHEANGHIEAFVNELAKLTSSLNQAIEVFGDTLEVRNLFG